MIANAICYWALSLPTVYVLTVVAGWGAVGVWVGYLPWMALTGLFFIHGFDAWCIGTGVVAGFVVMGVAIAPFLRKFGGFTVASYLGRRFDSRLLRNGFDRSQTERGRMTGLDVSLRLGLGLEGVIGDSGDGLVFASIGMRADSASTTKFLPSEVLNQGGGILAAVPARSGPSLRLRAPFLLVPGAHWHSMNRQMRWNGDFRGFPRFPARLCDGMTGRLRAWTGCLLILSARNFVISSDLAPINSGNSDFKIAKPSFTVESNSSKSSSAEVSGNSWSLNQFRKLIA